ncbi:hypothetical protein FRB99_002784 [Tulasnella sp. 403]|nr:hypothetical protein FRB99_002784 [Tulasnella sp. 403]
MDSTLKAKVKSKIRQVTRRKTTQESGTDTDDSVRSHFYEHLPSSIPGRASLTGSSEEFVDFLESDLVPPTTPNRLVAFADDPIKIQ